MLWKIFWAIVLSAGVAGCGSHSEARIDLASCEVQARHLYPHQAGNDDALGEAGDYAFECMMAKGYVSDSDFSRCPLGRGWVGEIDDKCYYKPSFWEDS